MDGCKEIQGLKSINDILKEVTSLDESNSDSYEKDISRISSELIMYYDNKGRHLYSEVSAFLYDINEEDLDYIYTNVEKIHEILQDYDKKNNSKYAKKVLKLEDHIRLELLRFENLKKTQEKNAIKLSENIAKETKRFDEEIKKYESKFRDLKDNYSNMKNNIDGLNSQIVSVIGIFSAIVITFFGGINFIESVLNSIGKVSKYRFVLGTFIVGFVMFNTIFMLLNFISKLTGKNIRSQCLYYKNDKCDLECKNRGRIWCVKEKHPTIFWINIVFISGIIMITLLYYIDHYNIVTEIIKYIKFKRF